jgi:hypothetical protein
MANTKAGSGVKRVGRAFRAFRQEPLPGGRIVRMSAPEGIAVIRAGDLGARARCSPRVIVSTDNDMRS